MTLRLSCCDLEWQFREKPMTYLKSAPSNQVYLMCHINIEKSQMYRVSQGFCMTYRVTLRKKATIGFLKWSKSIKVTVQMIFQKKFRMVATDRFSHPSSTVWDICNAVTLILFVVSTAQKTQLRLFFMCFLHFFKHNTKIEAK